MKSFNETASPRPNTDGFRLQHKVKMTYEEKNLFDQAQAFDRAAEDAASEFTNHVLTPVMDKKASERLKNIIKRHISKNWFDSDKNQMYERTRGKR